MPPKGDPPTLHWVSVTLDDGGQGNSQFKYRKEWERCQGEIKIKVFSQDFRKTAGAAKVVQERRGVKILNPSSFGREQGDC